ncbi:hypothetical protein MP228_012350 [Amoeboaphelidium protococcarum]|nr:hypothetical protein MP228_012350 [Amoeboaphelidium protococcarum]
MTVDPSQYANSESLENPLDELCSFNDTKFEFVNRLDDDDDDKDIQSYELSGKELEKYGKDNVLLTLAETCFESSKSRKRKYTIDLKADTDLFNDQHVDNMMKLMLEPGSLDNFNFDEDISAQNYMANVLDYYNIQLPYSPFSVCASLYQKARAHFLEQHALRCQVQEAAFTAFLTAIDKLDFGKLVEGVFSNEDGGRFVVSYYASGRGEITYFGEDYESEDLILSLPKFEDLAYYQLKQMAKEIQTMLQSKFAGVGLDIDVIPYQDEDSLFQIHCYLNLKYFERIQKYLTST